MTNPKAWPRLLTPMKVVTDSDAMPGGGWGSPSTTYDIPFTSFVFSNIPAFC
jgi:hypothetical protein